jgi:hypothetical protein
MEEAEEVHCFWGQKGLCSVPEETERSVFRNRGSALAKLFLIPRHSTQIICILVNLDRLYTLPLLKLKSIFFSIVCNGKYVY